MSQPQLAEVGIAPRGRGRDGSLHVVWINQHAAPVGGCEQYVLRTARLLAAEGVRNTLLYEVDGQLDQPFLEAFDGAFPLVEPQRQLESLAPDVGYVHRLADRQFIAPLTHSSVPCLRFYHDHSLFCLREHKYTAVKQQTCCRKTGLGCYACLGFAQRTERWPGIGIRSLGDLHRVQQANLHWDGHVVASDYMAQHLRDHGFDSSRLHTAPLFAEVDDESPLAPPRQPNLIVFAGQLVRGKGVDLLLNAMAMLPQHIELLIAGEGRQRAELEAQAQQLELNNRVTFTGRLDCRQLKLCLQQAAVVAMPSRAPETFGLAGLEASAEGAPVVAADVGGVGQWLRDGQNGLLFPSGDALQLAACLTQMFDDPVLARRLGETGRALCRSEFSPRRHVKHLMKIFGICVKGEMS